MLDLKYTIRQLFKSPGFTAVAVLTLGLCVGANLTIFAVLDAILLRPLPVSEPDRLVVVHNAYPGAGIERGNASITNYFDRREAIEAFESVSLYKERPYIIGEAGSARRVEGARITPDFFQTLGVPLAMGQTFTDTELDYGADQVAIISDRFWRSYWDADPNVLGRTLMMDSKGPITVIGVLPSGFRYLSSNAQIYRPYSHYREKRRPNARHSNDGQMIARLVSGRSIVDAQSELDVFNAQQLSEDPIGATVKDSGYHTWIASLHEDHVRTVQPVLVLVQTGVLCLLLLGVFNLAGLLLIRASARTKEIAVRQALGAGRWHITCTILVETMMLALGGGALGIVFAVYGIRVAGLLGADALPLGQEVRFDGRVAILSILVSIAVGICIAIPIIWLNLRDTINVYLQSETRGGTISRGVQHLRHSFIVSQIAIALVLLCAAGLLGVSLKQTIEKSPGFESRQVLTAELSIASRNYETNASRMALVGRLLDRIRVLPGVSHAAISSGLPFTTDGSVTTTIFTEGSAPASRHSLRAHYISSVSPDYWRTMNIPLLQGRFLDDSDNADPPRVAVIDEALARQHWPEGNAIGRRFSANPFSLYDNRVFGALGSEFAEESAYTVIGIVGNVKQNDLAEIQQRGSVYLPYRHSLRFQVLLRTSVSATAMASTVQRVIREIDPELPIGDFKTMQARIDDSLVTRRSPAILAVVFSGVALLLAAIGTYSVLAYAVSQRRREIGVRMALGATPEQIGCQFLSLGLRLLAVGTLLGCFGAWAAGRAMQSILFEVSSFHVPTFIGMAGVLSLVTLIACLLPALRAARVDPMAALRSG